MISLHLWPSKTFPKLVSILLLSVQNQTGFKFCSVVLLQTILGMNGYSGCQRLQETWRKVGLHSLTLLRLKSTSTNSFSL